jgi:glycosyltransferase involved in cell wall biosynthesis
VVDGKTGFLVEPGDVESMAMVMRHLLTEKSLAETMGRIGHNRVTVLFTKERYARQVEEVYMHELEKG